MYPFLIAAAVSSSVVLSLILIPKDPFYWFGPFAGVIAFIPVFMLLSRRISDKVTPIFEAAGKAAQAGNVPKAIEHFEEALAYKNWQLFLGKQIYTQIGTLHYGAGNDQKAIEFLQKGYPKVAEGHLILGTVLYRQGKQSEAREALEMGIRFNRKSPIIYNVLAYLLHKEKQTADAITVLEGLPKKIKDHPDSVENLKRLRNGKKLNMKPFGQLWYMLKFETPPGMRQQPQVRKGFRAPPKQKGRARKR